MRKVFRDPALQSHFRDAGFNKVPMISSEEIQFILDEMSKMRPEDEFAYNDKNRFKITYHCSFLDTNKGYKRQVHNLINRVFTPYVEKYLQDYRIVNANFYVKPPHKGDFAIHQNWPILQDLDDTSVTIWCPLQDTYRENGTIQFVPGSHKILPHVEGPALPGYFKDFKQELIDRWLKPVDVKAGEATIFDDGLLHWTAKNDSDAPRIAIQILCIPKNKAPVHFVGLPDDPTRLEVVEADDDFFIEQDFEDLAGRKPEWKSLGFVPNRNRFITEQEFAALLEKGPEIRKSLYTEN